MLAAGLTGLWLGAAAYGQTEILFDFGDEIPGESQTENYLGWLPATAVEFSNFRVAEWVEGGRTLSPPYFAEVKIVRNPDRSSGALFENAWLTTPLPPLDIHFVREIANDPTSSLELRLFEPLITSHKLAASGGEPTETLTVHGALACLRAHSFTNTGAKTPGAWSCFDLKTQLPTTYPEP